MLSILVKIQEAASQEEWIAFVEIEAVDVESIFKLIMSTLKEAGLSKDLCRGGAFDGASVMTSHGSLERAFAGH